MMLSLMLSAMFWIVAVLALAAMIGTWRRYAPAWDMLDAQRLSSHPVPVRYMTVRVIDHRHCALVPASDFRIKSPVDRLWHGRRAAA